MDKYTQKNKMWLDKRFKQCDKYGIYYAHQPIYGFRKGHSEPGLINRYIRTYWILKALSHLYFNSLLDVGGAEGYKAYIVRNIFNVIVKNCDLSEEACKRAEEIFQIESDTVDIHNLPYKNNEFDVVLCSETLEHVTDVQYATTELLRVAKNAVIITVPHENQEAVEKNIREEVPHDAHINSFTLDSFNFLELNGYRILKKKIISPLLEIPRGLIDADRIEYYDGMKYPKFFIMIFNMLTPIFRKIFGKKIASFIIKLDDFVCNHTDSYNAILFIILKNNECYDIKEHKKISISTLLDFSVPYYYLNKKDM